MLSANFGLSIFPINVDIFFQNTLFPVIYYYPSRLVPVSVTAVLVLLGLRVVSTTRVALQREMGGAPGSREWDASSLGTHRLQQSFARFKQSIV